MKDILKIMYEMLPLELRRGKILFINFSKPQVERIDCKNATCIYIAENEEQQVQVEKNINRRGEMYDTVMTFETGKGKNVVNNLEVWMENKKFDCIIGNPPYAGKGHPLYLRILETIKPMTNEVIWLCPSQWVKNYKDSDYVAEIKKTTCKDLIEHENVGNPFSDAGLANEVAVFHFGNAEKYENYEDIRLERFVKPKLAKSIWNKFDKWNAKNGNIDNYNKVDSKKKYYVRAQWIRGNQDLKTNRPKWDWTTLFGTDQRTDFSFKPNDLTNYWNFSTTEECKNFIASTETDILMFAHFISKISYSNNNQVLAIIPWFGDYTHEWTEDMIQKELGLTDEEVNYIHEEMKEFGWKTRK